MSGEESKAKTVTLKGYVGSQEVTIVIDKECIRRVGIQDGPFVDGGKIAESNAIILDDFYENTSPENRRAIWDWFTKPRKGTGAGAQDAQRGGLPDRDDAGAAQIQSDAPAVRGGAGAHFGKPYRRVAGAGAGKVVLMRYLNWRGEMRERRVLPHSAFRFGTTEWHDTPQWLFQATDLEDGKLKEFAMNGVFRWDCAEDQSLPWRDGVQWTEKPFVAAQGVVGGELVNFDPTDSVLTKLSEGSFDVSAEAVKKYGIEAFEALAGSGKVFIREDYPDACHPSHVTRASDASSFDEICTLCGARDIAGGGWGKLKYPCPQAGAKDE
jgi:hypothetical protein